MPQEPLSQGYWEEKQTTSRSYSFAPPWIQTMQYGVALKQILSMQCGTFAELRSGVALSADSLWNVASSEDSEYVEYVVAVLYTYSD